MQPTSNLCLLFAKGANEQIDGMLQKIRLPTCSETKQLLPGGAIPHEGFLGLTTANAIFQLRSRISAHPAAV
jgi:hypothetical protein